MTSPTAALAALVGKWREPTAQDECTLYTMGQRTARNVCADELEAALAALPASGWIPVSERLPDRAGLGSCLVFDANRPGKGVWQESIHPTWWGQFMPETNEWGPEVTHWMPLPAAPTPGEPT